MARSGTNHKGGRPKGKKMAKTIEREKVLEEIRNRVGKIAQRLLDAQVSIATGQAFLYKVHTNSKGMKDKPELITVEPIIRAYLNGELDNEKNDFYYITTKEPNNQALDSLFDRTFGKAKQGEMDLNVRLPEPILGGITKKRESPDK